MSKMQKVLDKIMVTLVMVLIISFIIPTYSHAKKKKSILADGFQTFICYLGDGVLSLGEKFFGESESIDVDPKALEHYGVKYGVGSIVSGKLQAFNINFFKTSEATKHVVYEPNSYALRNMYEPVYDEIDSFIENFNNSNEEKEVLIEIKNILTHSRYIDTGNKADSLTLYQFGPLLIRDYNGITIEKVWNDIYTDDPYINSNFYKFIVKYHSSLGDISDDADIFIDFIQEYTNKEDGNIDKEKFMREFAKIKPVIDQVYNLSCIEEEIKTPASQLSPVISKFYSALRMIALVALLSVLVYIGIKVVISSTANDKAKYKQKLLNVVVAMCLLFIMQYIMAISFYVIDIINDGIGANVISENGDDVLMTEIRNKADISKSTSEVLVYTIIYAVLVFMTIWFTIVYIKRMLTIILLTILSPLVTVTYPIDKEKDGKAQAFGFWIKEYVFNILIQPIHLILYYVFVQSTIELVKNGNFFWAIVVLFFMMQAERLIRRMFKLDSSSTLPDSKVSFAGGMAAAAAIKRLAGKAKSSGKKHLSSKGDSQNQDTRIRQRDPEEYNDDNGDIRQNDISDSNEQDLNRGESDKDRQNNQDSKNQEANSGNQNRDSNKNIKNQEKASQNVQKKSKKDGKKKSIKKGIATIARKKFTAKKVIGGLAKTAKVAGTIGLGAVGGTFGLAATIASGDIKNLDNFVAGGVGAGVGVASLASAGVKGAVNLGKGAKNQGTDIVDTYKIGANGWDSQGYQDKVLIPRIKKKNAKDKEIQDKYERELGSQEFLNSKERDELYNAGIIDEDIIIKAIKQKQRDKISNKEMIQNTLIATRIKDMKDLENREKQLRKNISNNGLSGVALDRAVNERMKRIRELSGVH